MVAISLVSLKEKPSQEFGGKFKIKNIKAHLDTIELDLAPAIEYPSYGPIQKTRKWRHASIQLDIKDLPALMAALVNQLEQFHTGLHKTLSEVAGGTHRATQAYDNRGDYADINWERVRALLDKRKVAATAST